MTIVDQGGPDYRVKVVMSENAPNLPKCTEFGIEMN